ncbi:HIT domain-containing protein [Terrihabitans sp. B22-R8]|uniref:HIT domain-containing protein n=1 Tax=Terrihabitans sp. B22-R8 TaxID=3425128 RepID=UPI00403D2BD4
MSDAFRLHPRLEADTARVCDLALSRVLLMNDARFPWLILVPRRPDLVEIVDLAHTERMLLMDEIASASRALRAVAPCDKLNVGALGNLVPQLHVHVVSRVEGDPAWPGPVWGSGPARPYDDAWRAGVVQAMRAELERD